MSVSMMAASARTVVPDYAQKARYLLPDRDERSREILRPVQIEPGAKITSMANGSVKPSGFGEAAAILRAGDAYAASLLKAAEKRMGVWLEGSLQPSVFDNWQQRQGISSYQAASRLR